VRGSPGLPIGLVWGLFLGSSPLAGQSVLVGTVRADSTGRPLSGVEVLVAGSESRTTTDNSGRYALNRLPSGRRQILFRYPGFRPVREWVELGKVDTVWVNPLLTPETVRLDSIVVTAAPAAPRGIGREAFEERKKLGFGFFLDSTVMRRNEHRRLADLFSGRAGIRVIRTGVLDNAYLVSTRLEQRDGDCFLQIYLDGAPVGRGGVGGTVNAPNLKDFDVASIESVEVYAGAAGVPVEYGGASAQCGVVLLWSRRG
jgi:hypothetical protein